MSVSVYVPDGTKILHMAYADFVSRQIGRPVHVVQYDDGLPILAVKLFSDGQPYTIPSNADINIKLSKRDGKFVYNPALGCDSERHTAYFEITYQMAVFAGEISPVIEVIIGNSIVASSSVSIVIDRNPIQNDAIESTSEWKRIQASVEYVKEAINAAAYASASRSAAKMSESNAASYAANARSSESNAASYAVNARSSETNAANYAANARSAERNAANYATNASTSETNASNAVTAASARAAEAESYARGGTGIRANEDADNAKFYCDQSKNSSEISKLYLSKVEQAGNAAIEKIDNALDMDVPNFLVDLSTGHLLFQGGRFMFSVNDRGHLEWGLAV